MGPVVAWSLILAIGFAPESADESARAAVKKLAQEMGDATVKGDFASVFDHTYPALVEKLGGRAKALEVTQASLKQLKDKGLAFKRFEVGEPGEFYAEGGNVFIVVPTKLELTTPAGTLLSKSYLLGISSDARKSWTFVDGAGMQDEQTRRQVLPKMPAKLKLPELQPAEIVKDK